MATARTALEWLTTQGLGLELRYDLVAELRDRVPADGAFTVNVECGPL